MMPEHSAEITDMFACTRICKTATALWSALGTDNRTGNHLREMTGEIAEFACIFACQNVRFKIENVVKKGLECGAKADTVPTPAQIMNRETSKAHQLGMSWQNKTRSRERPNLTQKAKIILFFVESEATLLKRAAAREIKGRREDDGVSGRPSTDSWLVLGKAVYDPNRDQLLNADGTYVDLRAQSAIVLQCLVENIDELVARDTLIDTVWKDVSVTDDSLAQCIADIRRAIGDTDRKIIQTVPKRGFILHGMVQQRDASVGEVSGSMTTLGGKPAQVIALSKPANTEPFASASIGDDRVFETLHFDDLTIAAETCLKQAQSDGSSFALDAADRDPKHLLALLDAAKPGEVLSSFDIQTESETHPQLVFEDLGHVGAAQTIRAFRLWPDRSRDDADISLHRDQPILPTIAVLPLQSYDQGTADLLGTVFADRMTAALSGSEELNVTSRLSAASFIHGKTDLREAGRLLNAQFILSGMYLRRGEALQLNLEFTEVDSQRVLWTLCLDVQQNDLLHDFEAAYEIVAKTRRAVVINEIRRANINPLSSLQNYSLMFAAVGLMHRLSPRHFKQGRDLLDALSDRVPHHPTPLAWRARWHLLRVVQGWSQSPDADARAALDCTTRALDLDPENVLALACEGHILTNLLHRLDDAEDRYDRALEINPNDANARSLRGMLRAFQDRGEKGVRDTERALHLAPLDPLRFFYLTMAAGACLTPKDFERSESLARAALRLNSTHTSALRVLAVAQQSQGKADQAKETVGKLLKLQPDLRVDQWLKSSPSAGFNTGDAFAKALREAGVPN